MLRYLFLFALVLPLGASPQGAEQVVADHQARLQAALKRIQEAPNVEEKRRIWDAAPDADEFGEKLLRELDGNWSKEWILDYAPKLLAFAPEYSLKPVAKFPGKTPLGVIRDSAEKFSFQSEKIGPLCIALTLDSGPKTRKFVEKAESSHVSKKVQGQAALALAMLIGEMGQGAETAAQRLTLLKKAIKEAGNDKIGNRTVNEFAMEQIYSITNLEKGRPAPDLLGWNVRSEAMRLSDFKVKPVALIFWNSRMKKASETMQYMRKIQANLEPKGVAVLGVAFESREALREMVKTGEVTWQNWVDDEAKLGSQYRVNDYPAAWVLDKEGVVQYKGVPGAFVEITAEALLQ